MGAFRGALIAVEDTGLRAVVVVLEEELSLKLPCGVRNVLLPTVLAGEAVVVFKSGLEVEVEGKCKVWLEEEDRAGADLFGEHCFRWVVDKKPLGLTEELDKDGLDEGDILFWSLPLNEGFETGDWPDTIFFTVLVVFMDTGVKTLPVAEVTVFTIPGEELILLRDLFEDGLIIFSDTFVLCFKVDLFWFKEIFAGAKFFNVLFGSSLLGWEDLDCINNFGEDFKGEMVTLGVFEGFSSFKEEVCVERSWLLSGEALFGEGVLGLVGSPTINEFEVETALEIWFRDLLEIFEAPVSQLSPSKVDVLESVIEDEVFELLISEVILDDSLLAWDDSKGEFFSFEEELVSGLAPSVVFFTSDFKISDCASAFLSGESSFAGVVAGAGSTLSTLAL